MTRLVLHIGHPKTGTTALQFALDANRERLGKFGILYPAAGKEHKHAVLTPYLMKVPPTPATRRRTKLDGEDLIAFSRHVWDALKADVAATRPDVVVLSAESFWNPTSVNAAASFHEKLNEIASEIQVVGYLRSPPQRYLSRLNQKVRMLRELPIVEGRFYQKAITAYSVTGFENISLQVFDKTMLRDGDIVNDFCQRFLPELKTPLDRETIRRTNESISVEALAVMREISTSESASVFLRQRPARRTRILKSLREFDRELTGATPPQLHPQIRDTVIARSADLIWLRDERGIEFPDVDYSLVGSETKIDLESIQEIAALCPLNPSRLSELRNMIANQFPKLRL
jgi:hypothetical protein